jgi:protein-tyrosine phosphatase
MNTSSNNSLNELNEIINDLKRKCSQLESQLQVVQGQYQKVSEDYRDLRKHHARLSAQTMRLQSRLSQQVSEQTSAFIAQHQQLDIQRTESHQLLREVMAERTSYHWITPNMAIGDAESTYEPFDVVIDLNFEGELIALGDTRRHHDIQTITQESRQQITRIAIYDHPSEKEFMKKVLHSMIPSLVQSTSFIPSLKILFHCYAGVSRSASLGITWLAEMESCTYEEALRKVQEKRPQVNPNPGFVEAIKEVLSELRTMRSMRSMQSAQSMQQNQGMILV